MMKKKNVFEKGMSCLETMDTTARACFNSSPFRELAALLTINTPA